MVVRRSDNNAGYVRACCAHYTTRVLWKNAFSTKDMRSHAGQARIYILKRDILRVKAQRRIRAVVVDKAESEKTRPGPAAYWIRGAASGTAAATANDKIRGCKDIRSRLRSRELALARGRITIWSVQEGYSRTMEMRVIFAPGTLMHSRTCIFKFYRTSGNNSSYLIDLLFLTKWRNGR